GFVAAIPPEDPEEADVQIDEGLDPGSSIFQRLIETGQPAFSLDDIGTRITSLRDLAIRLDALDNVPNNVKLDDTTTPGVTTLDVGIQKTLSGQADFAVRAAGGPVDLGGTLEISARVTLHIRFGFEARGFFIDSNTTDSTLAINNITITGPVDGIGRFGFTNVNVTDGKLNFDPNVQLAVTLHEPG